MSLSINYARMGMFILTPTYDMSIWYINYMSSTCLMKCLLQKLWYFCFTVSWHWHVYIFVVFLLWKFPTSVWFPTWSLVYSLRSKSLARCKKLSNFSVNISSTIIHINLKSLCAKCLVWCKLKFQKSCRERFYFFIPKFADFCWRVAIWNGESIMLVD